MSLKKLRRAHPLTYAFRQWPGVRLLVMRAAGPVRWLMVGLALVGVITTAVDADTPRIVLDAIYGEPSIRHASRLVVVGLVQTCVGCLAVAGGVSIFELAALRVEVEVAGKPGAGSTASGQPGAGSTA